MARGPLKPDSWYEKQGLVAPKHIVHHGSERVDSDNHICFWKHKEGPWLHCDEGKGYGHGIPYDHINSRLIGTSDEGAPILADIVLANQDQVDKEKAMLHHSS
jgi:hypothetical protein